MNKINIQRGDEFASAGTGWISKSILFISRLTSLQSEAKYSHVGIILNNKGKTIEALWDGIKYDSLDKYIGKQVIIFRRINVSDDVKQYAISRVKYFKGRPYPYWRFIWHAIPGLSKIRLIKIPVCSELVKYYQRI